MKFSKNKSNFIKRHQILTKNMEILNELISTYKDYPKEGSEQRTVQLFAPGGKQTVTPESQNTPRRTP